jgi:hypothetical protein
MLSSNPLQQHEAMSVRLSAKANPRAVKCNENEVLRLGTLPSIALNWDALTLGRASVNVAAKRSLFEMESETNDESTHVNDWGHLLAGMLDGSRYGNLMKSGTDLINWQNNYGKIKKVKVFFFKDPNNVLALKALTASAMSPISKAYTLESVRNQAQIMCLWNIQRDRTEGDKPNGTSSFTIRQSEDESAIDCVKVEVISNGLGRPATFQVSSLFHQINERKTCNIVSTAKTGWGTFVLNTITVAAAQSNGYCCLWDASKFAPDQPKPHMATVNDSLTDNLTMIRGYGFYEGCGYFAALRDLGIDDLDFNSALNWHNQQLIWVHVVLTTPLQELMDTLSGKNEAGKDPFEAIKSTAKMIVPPKEKMLTTLDEYLATANEIVIQQGNLSLRELYNHFENKVDRDNLDTNKMKTLFGSKNKLWGIVYWWSVLTDDDEPIEKHIGYRTVSEESVPFHIECRPGSNGDAPTAIATPVSELLRNIW